MRNKTLRIVKLAVLWILLISMSASVALAEVSSSGAVGGETYVHDTAFSQVHNLSGVFSSFTEYFYSGEWDVHGAVLNLCYAVTPLAMLDVSDITLSLNGQRFLSFRPAEADGKTQYSTIELPTEAITEGINSLTIEAYLRTNESEPCVDDVSTASWLTVFNDSTVSLSYTPIAECYDIASLYEQFTSIDALENEQSCVYIPSSATDACLTAAAYVLSGISSNAQLSYENIKLCATDRMNDIYGSKYAIYVTDTASMISSVKSLLSASQLDAAKDYAVLAYVRPQSGCNVLVLFSDNIEALKTGGRLFGNKIYMSQLSTVSKAISATDNISIAKETSDSREIPLSTTGAYLKGPFRQSTDFFINNSVDRLTEAGSEIHLAMRYAQNLNFDRSLVTVYINDTPIGSKKLELESASDDIAVFTIPNNLNLVGNFSIRVAFDLEIPDLWCTIRQEEMPWAYVTNESFLKVNTQDIPYLIFEYYPAPFISDGRMNEVEMILPVIPSTNDIEAMRGVMITLGRSLSNNDGHINVCRYSSMGDLTDKNVIAIGKLSDNPIAQQINDRLFFKFSPKGTTILSNEKLLIEPNYGATLGSGQLLYSPYSEDRHALLLVSGVTDSGVLNAASYLSNTRSLWEISGDGYVTDGEKVQFYRFKEDNSKTQTLSERLDQQEDALLLLLLCGGVLLILVIALTVIVVKYRKAQKYAKAK